jgi:hypothetical protein
MLGDSDLDECQSLALCRTADSDGGTHFAGTHTGRSFREGAERSPMEHSS